MKRMTVADFAKAVDDRKAASLLKKPLIVEGGVGCARRAPLIVKCRGADGTYGTSLEYFTPAVSKQKRTFESSRSSPRSGNITTFLWSGIL